MTTYLPDGFEPNFREEYDQNNWPYPFLLRSDGPDGMKLLLAFETEAKRSEWINDRPHSATL